MRRIAPLLVAGLSLASTVNAQNGPDVIVGDLYDFANYGTGSIGSDTYRAYAVGTISCNVGNTVLLWISNNNQHPVIAQNMFRLKDGRFEQLGQSWLKHGFTALQGTVCSSCTAYPNGTRLGVGCSDPYSASLNGGQGGGPKWQVNAATGIFTYPHAGGGTAPDNLWRRLQVKESELNNAGALYFVEGQYVTQDDAAAGNKNNNASYRRVTFNASMNLQGQSTTQREKPAIQAWQDHGGGVGIPDPNVTLVNLDIPGDGRLILGGRATLNQDGTWHYEYAIQNLSSDQAARSFSVPLPDLVSVTNIGFRDVDYRNGEKQTGTDWTTNLGTSAIEWSTASYTGTEAAGGNEYSANALRWGTLYNFRFDANASPTTATVDIGLFKPGATNSISGTIVVPGTVDSTGPINDACATALTVTNGTYSFSTSSAVTEGFTESGCAGGGSDVTNDIWYRYTAGCSGSVTVATCGTAFDTKVFVYSGACPSGPDSALACDDNGCGSASTVTFAATSGATYLFRIGSSGSVGGAGTLTITGPNCGPVPPANDTCAAAIPMADGQSYAGTTVNATASTTSEVPSNQCGQSGSSPDVWYSYRPVTTGSVTFSTCGAAAYDTVVSIHSGSCGALTSIACVDDTSGCGNATRVSANLTANTTYRIRVAGYQGQTGTFTLSVTGGGGTIDPPPVNDNCNNRAGINDGSSAFTTLGATTDGPAHASCFATNGGLIHNDIWFNYPSQVTGSLSISICDAGFDTRIAVYSGDNCTNFDTRLLVCNDDSCGTGSAVTLSILSGQHYTIRIGGASSTARGSGHITIASDPTEIYLCSFTQTSTTLPGPLTVRNEDIAAYNTVTGVWSMVFDGSDLGLSPLTIDALAVLPNDDILMSFTTDASVPGLIGGPDGTLVDDADIVQFHPTSLGDTTTGTLTFYFDGSDVGLDPANNSHDIDALAIDSMGALYISCTGTHSILGTKSLDEDILKFTPSTVGAATAGTWAMWFDGSDVELSTTSDEDVDALAFDGSSALMSTFGAFAVTGASGTGQDIVKFTPSSTGTTTAGSYSMFRVLSGIGVDPLVNLNAFEYTTDPFAGVNFARAADVPAPACVADFNADGVADSDDYFDFMNQFFMGEADIDGSGATDSADYFDFIEAFARGC